MLGLIVFSILIGCILSIMEEKAKPMTDLFRFIPVGLIFLIASTVVQTERPLVVLQELAVFFPTVVLSLLLHGFGTLPLLYLLVTRRNPYTFVRNMSKALLTAFGTSSSVTAVAVSIGAASAPGIGIITMTIASMAVGLPGDQILLVAPVDWIIERFRAVVNVNGDSLGAGIVNHLSSKVLNSETDSKQETDAKDRSRSISLGETEGLV
ncbi:Excitatory amino acid transporter 1 [Mizuhopecten yessoensis]|uniref:Amino acid transporter n=1 Tax=Mizuhopecten yessoensis TaxID=6573 RepID=A0A210Q7Q6_MIZYE|nr:Excitatory amino acid transporter 1 [Mizuhopecten yessoensis]